jgi:hypothetical protein
MYSKRELQKKLRDLRCEKLLAGVRPFVGSAHATSTSGCTLNRAADDGGGETSPA